MLETDEISMSLLERFQLSSFFEILMRNLEFSEILIGRYTVTMQRDSNLNLLDLFKIPLRNYLTMVTQVVGRQVWLN